MSSAFGSPLAQDHVALEKLRTSISGLGLGDFELSDGFLLRWLRAKDFNVGKAKELLETHLEYDRRHDVLNILNWEPPDWFHSEYFYEVTGVTPEGNPVLIASFGVWDLRKASETRQDENWHRYCDQIWTKLENRVKETGASQAIAIYDYAGHSIRQAVSMATLQLFMEFARRCEANHPGLFKDTFFINDSFVFDNTHSKFRGKILHYSINMLTPEILRMDNVDLN